MVNELASVIFIIIGISFFIWLVAKDDNRSEKALKYWANKNNYEILEKSYAFPLSLKRLAVCRGKVIYNVKVKENEGFIRKGTVTLGKCWKGLWGEIEDISAEVTWYK